tara:strand:+ start:3727 stop:3900 length:174 start_codon:yes stop_codon:yes gene_type:complete
LDILGVTVAEPAYLGDYSQAAADFRHRSMAAFAAAVDPGPVDKYMCYIINRKKQWKI